jgi:hypothetical protein
LGVHRILEIDAAAGGSTRISSTTPATGQEETRSRE